MGRLRLCDARPHLLVVTAPPAGRRGGSASPRGSGAGRRPSEGSCRVSAGARHWPGLRWRPGRKVAAKARVPTGPPRAPVSCGGCDQVPQSRCWNRKSETEAWAGLCPRGLQGRVRPASCGSRWRPAAGQCSLRLRRRHAASRGLCVSSSVPVYGAGPPAPRRPHCETLGLTAETSSRVRACVCSRVSVGMSLGGPFKPPHLAGL